MSTLHLCWRTKLQGRLGVTEKASSKKRTKTLGGLSGKLLAVASEYRFAVYKKLIAKRRGKMSGKDSPMRFGAYDAASVDKRK